MTQPQQQQVSISDLQIEFDVRSKAELDSRVNLFSELIEAGIYLPPIEVYEKEGRMFVKDGRHRIAAYKKLGKKHIQAKVVPYTTLVDMVVGAFGANISKSGPPLPPTMEDFSKVIRLLQKEGLKKDDIIPLIVKLGVPPLFAKKVVRDTMNSIKQLNALHATESVKAKRMTIVEAAKHYNVPLEVIKRKLDKDVYGIDRFGLDLNKKLRALRNFIQDKVQVLGTSGNEELAHEAIKVVAQKQTADFASWLSAQEVAAR
jgi:hypothetical protein